MAEIEKLIAELKNGTPDAKNAALLTLIDAGKQSVQCLTGAIENASTGQIEEVLSAIDWECDPQNQASDQPFVALRDLIEDDSWFMVAAIRFFEKAGSIAVEALLPLLAQPRAELRGWTAYTLGVIGDKAAIPALLDRLSADSDGERVRVVAALGKLKAKQAVLKLVDFLDHPHRDTQQVAAEALGEIGDARAIAPLISELRERQRNVDAVSAALRRFGALAVEPLIQLLSDDGASRVRDLVTMNLWMLGDPRAIAPLIEVVTTTKEAAFQKNAIEALGLLKARQAIQPIAHVFFTAQHYDLRFACAQAIGQAGGADAYRVLVQAIQLGNFDLQHAAILGMGEFTPSAEFDLSPLIAMLQENNTSLRSASVVALGNLRDARASPALTTALDDPEVAVEKYAIWALGKIGDPRVRHALENKLRSENEVIRHEAREALEKLETNAS